jgi:outer membrane receptor protein involved in Fe transport
VKNNKKLLLSLAITTALGGQVGFAADVEDEDNVIIVTAQKRSERITEVPISISVFPEEAIDQTGIQELRELAEFIPNVLITQGTDFNSRILIRGVGAPSRNIGFDSRVGVYLDGVYLGQGPAVNQDLVDLERVEVLRGPQGTLFGKNTVAGAISLISKKPHHEFEAKATANVANYSGTELRVSANMPISDTVTSKVAFSSRKRDGYIQNVFNPADVATTFVAGIDPGTGAPIVVPIAAAIVGTFNPAFAAFGFGPHPTNGIGPSTNPPNIDLNNQDTQSWRAQVRYQPTDALDINISFDGLSSDRRPVLGVNITDTFGAYPERNAPANDEVSWSNPGLEKRDIDGVFCIQIKPV